MNADSNHKNSRCRLIGIPEKKATLWWRFVYRKKSIGKRKVFPYLQMTGMYCPECRHVQKFSDRCSHCGNNFFCFVAIESKKLPKLRLSSGKIDLETHKNIMHSFQSSSKRGQGTRLLSAGLTAFLIILSVIGVIQYQNHLQKQYTQNFISALYGINSGMNMASRVYEGKYKAWKDGTPESAIKSAIVDEQAAADLNLVKGEVDGIMLKINKPATEYVNAFRILQKLYGIYRQVHTSIAGSAMNATILQKKDFAGARSEYYREINNLKLNLPVRLKDELRTAGKRYNLDFMALNN
ncbi:MAG: hypothetical protein ABFD57_11270 [Smithella sp.]